ncbi:hypothetical protein EV421DRAFT_1800050 [Armillaria borealis]|uniref:Uncharacterized protein n=1 Tax=Armillaria borealis TaxID=47425 RepID=A0AA39JLS8_9AGAR|nr:hypothetical protein EV421DRAFT_1800050 [Armillaria borealis]
MVVNKKAQVGPGMASRTNSTQPLPRKKVSASPLATPARPSTPPPPLEPIPLPKKKAKPKKKAVKKRGWPFPDRVLVVFLALFVAYALRVCPSDYGLQDPVCWGLAKYRTGVVDVRVVEHPRVRPVVEKGAEVLRPVVRRAVRGVEEFVEPRYRAYLKPYVDPISRYASVVTPYVRKGYTTVSPYVHKGYTVVAPYVQRAYGFGRPRVVGAYRVCARRLGELRREFVDPHVGVLWIKVVELSRGHVPPPSQAPEPTTTPSEEPPTKEPVPTSSSAEPAPTSTSDSTPIEELPTSEPASTSDPALIEEPVQSESTPEPAPTTEETVPTSSAEPVTTSSDSESTSSAEPSSNPPTVSDSEPTSLATEDPVSTSSSSDEYDDFLADLGIDFDAANTPVSSTATSTSFTPPTEVTRDPAAIASKRANITARHATWASQLDTLAAARAATVRTNLSRIRSRAAAVLFGQAVEDEETDFVGGVHVSKLLDAFVDEAEKLVGGLEGWWKKEPKDGERGEKEKLEALVREMGERVEKWATRVREDEVRECVVASREVKALAQKAQEDLGLDYAWLEDVTYDDWQRYHDLMRGASHPFFAFSY